MKDTKKNKNLGAGTLSMPTIVSSLNDASGEKPKLSATEILAGKNKNKKPEQEKG